MEEFSFELPMLFAKAIKNGDVKIKTCVVQKLLKNATVLKHSSSSSTIAIMGNLKYKTGSDTSDLVGILNGKVMPVIIKLSFKSEHPDEDNSLEIEEKVYQEIINNILQQHFSPNVVGCLASFKCDKFIELMRKKGVGSKNKPLYTEMHSQMHRIEKKNSGEYDFHDATFLVLERVQGKTLGDFLSDRKNFNEPHVIFSIIFQVLYTLIIFNILGLRHNDLHLGNIYLQMQDIVPTYFVYFITDTTYFAIPIDVAIPKIYDFDLSAIKGVVNTKISFEDKDKEIQSMCMNYGICNQDNPKFDAFTFLKFLYDSANTHGIQYLKVFCLHCAKKELYNKYIGPPSGFYGRICNLATQSFDDYSRELEEYEERAQLYEEEDLDADELGSPPSTPLVGTAAFKSVRSTLCQGNWVPPDDLMMLPIDMLALQNFKIYKHTLPDFDPLYKPTSEEDFMKKNIFLLPTVNRSNIIDALVNKEINPIKFTK